MTRYTAFLSYSSRYAEWAQAFSQHLESCLSFAGHPGRIFLDRFDLVPGHSWPDQLHQQLRQSDRLILLVTPETMESRRVGDEWVAFITDRPDWRDGRLLLVHLVDSPLPSPLNVIQQVDLRGHDAEVYRQGLRKLTASLLGSRDERRLPDLPPELIPPQPPETVWPTALRRKILQWLTPLIKRKSYRHLFSESLGWAPDALDHYPDEACTASAMLVRASFDTDRVSALRLLDLLGEQLMGEESDETLLELAALHEQLEGANRKDSERDLLQLWLDSVAADHERLIPGLPHLSEPALLDRIYVSLEMRADLGPVSPRRQDMPPERCFGMRELLLLDPADHSWVTRRWVVRGDPGAGKTTLLRHLAGSLAREPQPFWIPVLEPLSQLLREEGFLLDQIARRFERAGHPARPLRDLLERAGQEGRLLLLFDGLDEVPRERRAEAEALLRDLSAHWSATPVVVTTRPIGYRSPSSAFREVEVLPLDREQCREFLLRWSARRSGAIRNVSVDAQLAVLESSPSLWKLAGNPFYLTLLALLLEEGQEPSRHWPQIYDQVFELLLEGRHRPEGQPIPYKEGVRRALRYIAYGMTRDNRDSEPAGDLEARLYRPEADPLRTVLERVPRWQKSLRAFLDDVADRTGILGPHDGVGADWRFWHRSFRETLAAAWLADRLQEEGETAVLEHAQTIVGEESRWAEPYALLAGRVDDPDGLVRALTRKNQALGLRAVATVQGLRDDTLREILVLSESWEQRAQVYRKAPELIGDPERALALLDRLRRGTHDGNDLYFLDLAIADVGRRWPDYAEPATTLRQRLYRHLPAPDEALFRAVETPRDGRVELWREIPAGSFLMGSPDGESRWRDEGPRHRVTLLKPFRLTAVPLTNVQYRAFDPAGGHGGDLYPVTGVTWFAAVSFCRWLADSFAWARGARLPTEEEWEIACRCGVLTRYWSGDSERDLARVGWYLYNSGSRSHPVGEKPANSWGLYDMHGNVWEWTANRLTSGYQGREAGIAIDPKDIANETDWEPNGARRVFRGGSAWLGADLARAATRDSRTPAWQHGDLGFRVLLPFVDLQRPRSSTDYP